MSPFYIVGLVVVYYLGKMGSGKSSKPKAEASPPVWTLPKTDSPVLPPLPKTGSNLPQNPPTASDVEAAFNALPQPPRDSVKVAYESGTDADKLDVLATQLESEYPLVALALHTRARQIRASQSAQSAQVSGRSRSWIR